MQLPVSKIIKERVRQLHYSSPEYKPEPGMTQNYNVCPMCGIITKLQSVEQVEGSDVDLIVQSDSMVCNTCNNVKHLHPHIHEWVNLLFSNLAFQESIKQPVSQVQPKQIEKTQDAPKDFIDVELVNNEEN